MPLDIGMHNVAFVFSDGIQASNMLAISRIFVALVFLFSPEVPNCHRFCYIIDLREKKLGGPYNGAFARCAYSKKRPVNDMLRDSNCAIGKLGQNLGVRIAQRVSVIPLTII